jgi:CHAT domain-containing protein
VIFTLARALGRAGAPVEAAERASEAVARLEAAGDDDDLYQALLVHAELERRTGQLVVSAAAFSSAHELIHQLEMSRLKPERYLRVAELQHQEGVGARAWAQELWGPAGVERLHQLEMTVLRAGDAQGAGRFRDAIQIYEETRRMWLEVRAALRVCVIDRHLAGCYAAVGLTERALQSVGSAEAEARALGWAGGEAVACVEMAGILMTFSTSSGRDPIALIARARALDTLGDSYGRLIDDGVIDAVEARIAQVFGALDLAEQSLSRAVSRAEDRRDHMRGSAYLARLIRLQLKAGKAEDARRSAELLAELPDATPQVTFQKLATANLLLPESEPGSSRQFSDLVTACDAYERMRAEAVRIGSLDEFRLLWEPPHDQAAEVALELDRAAEAFHLLERGKARVLLDALGSASPLARESAMHPLRAADAKSILKGLGYEAAIVELLVGKRGLWAITIKAEADELARKVWPLDSDGEWPIKELGLVPGQTLLAHGAIQSIATALDQWAGEQTHVFLVPHAGLHTVPLHLTLTNGVYSARPGTSYLPSASVLQRPKPISRKPGAARVVIGGDPTEDLPNAEAECRQVATRYGVAPVLGRDVTSEWLSERLAQAGGPVKLVHLACHAHFDEARPERSGLALAPDTPGLPWDRYHVATAAELSELEWQGALVVLSACGSGRNAVRRGDELVGLTQMLLTAGAALAVVSLWDVHDEATSLVMDSFYSDVASHRSWRLRAITDALTKAQDDVRGSPRIAAETRAETTRDAMPMLAGARLGNATNYEDPWFWGAFVVVGTD